ncbi:MAG: 5,10-methylenetetrahydrofolate reductase [Candidatus Omnitrophica bacterium CG_4_9_14_0_2_um_filter_42_8]|nr:MAG: 5,10-methylenetetrahydrofolate reductase [Candidatus Omnitrophica bacterium CG22_combo_CG10-13_8_21_14_all_43_16]PJC48287.1 MAG: 5,10-methylenetetrahydrofolate reductase [Candidatus Omnitrophica bacterium CG_4_9_14_0_2_um_filter_42_8]
MALCDKIKSGKFIITSEIAPPKGIDVEEILKDAELVKGRVDAINVTDLQSSVMRTGSLAICKLLIERGLEPVFQITCRDRNRLALQSDLLSAAVFGIENVLALTGDHPALGDHPGAKPVFDLDSMQLLEAIRDLQAGKDMAGKELKGSPKFCVGAVVNPGADPIEPEIMKMEKKIQSGAQFFQTQAIYEMHLFEKFLKASEHLHTTIIAGIVLLKSAGMARYMNKNVAGVFVPDNLIEEIDKAKDKSAKSIEIAARLIKELKPMCQGVHVMPIGWDKKVPLVLDAAGL